MFAPYHYFPRANSMAMVVAKQKEHRRTRDLAASFDENGPIAGYLTPQVCFKHVLDQKVTYGFLYPRVGSRGF